MPAHGLAPAGAAVLQRSSRFGGQSVVGRKTAAAVTVRVGAAPRPVALAAASADPVYELVPLPKTSAELLNTGLWTGEKVDVLPSAELLIGGAGSGADITLPYITAKEPRARVEQDGMDLYVRALDSANAVAVGERKLYPQMGRMKVSLGQIIVIDPTTKYVVKAGKGYKEPPAKRAADPLEGFSKSDAKPAEPAAPKPAAAAAAAPAVPPPVAALAAGLSGNVDALLDSLRARKPVVKKAAPEPQAPSWDEVYDKAPSDLVVDRLLEEVRGTSFGAAASAEKDARVLQLVGVLEKRGRDIKHLDNPLIFGNYNVAYVSAGAAQKGQPAGGRFRSGPTSLLFQTTAMFQNIALPDTVVNKIYVRVLGLLPLLVSLRGRFAAAPINDGATVKVDFEGSQLTVFGAPLTIGPPSDVTLTTTYLDTRVRLGKGSFGSIFVFERGGAADADAWAEVLKPAAAPPALVYGGLVAAGSVALYYLWVASCKASTVIASTLLQRSPTPPGVIFALTLGVIVLLANLFQGGIIQVKASASAPAGA